MQQQEVSITSSCPQLLLDTQTDGELLDICDEDVQDVQEDDDMASDDNTWEGMQQLSPCSSVPLSSQDTPNTDTPSTTGRIFMVERLVKAAGGHRPSILFDGRLLDVLASTTSSGGYMLQQVPDGKELQLSLRYEPPSPKFSRACPGMTSYRLKLLQGSHFLYMLRGLPQEAVLDTAARAVSWGTLHLVFETCHQLDSFLAVLKHVQVVPGQAWPDSIAALWSSAQDSNVDAQTQASAAVQRSASMLRDLTGSVSSRQRQQVHAEPVHASAGLHHTADVSRTSDKGKAPLGSAWHAVCSFVHKHVLVATVAGLTAATCFMLARSVRNRN